MNKIALQISPVSKSAYFADYLTVAQQEFNQVIGDIPLNYRSYGSLEFFELEDDGLDLQKLLRLSFVQGVYALENNLLRPLESKADYHLHEDFVIGNRFKGKTNEHLTQLLINVALAALDENPGNNLKLLDPMCGRGTTLLWALRYGINAKGIEQDATALIDIHRNLKKWTKLHRQKHKLTEGFIGKPNKQQQGKFINFSIPTNTLRLAVGDARHADQIYKKDRFHLIACDLPYGVQHFTDDKTRNPLAVIEQCVNPWKQCLHRNGVIVLAYNCNNPKRQDLINTFEKEGFTAQPFSAKHRMSESIVRDVVILKP